MTADKDGEATPREIPESVHLLGAMFLMLIAFGSLIIAGSFALSVWGPGSNTTSHASNALGAAAVGLAAAIMAVKEVDQVDER